MYVQYGERPYGKCDVVPELFYVATWFFHINFVPLVPLGTRLVLGKSGNSYRMMKIPLSIRSLGYAWLRTLSFLGAIGCGIWAFAAINDQRGIQTDWSEIEMPAICIAFCLIVFAWVMVYPRKKMPSYERACALGRLAGLNERGWAAMNVLYGRDPLEIPAVQPQ